MQSIVAKLVGLQFFLGVQLKGRRSVLPDESLRKPKRMQLPSKKMLYQ